MKTSLDLENVLTRLQIVVVAGTIVATVAGFLLKQAQWGILIGLVILLAGLAGIHLAKVERKIPMSERTEQVFWFDSRQRVTAGILLSGLLLLANLVQFFPPTSRFVQSVFWNAAPPGTRYVEQYNFSVGSFFGADTKPGTGTGSLQVVNVYQGSRAAGAYRFEYALPQANSKSYAGFWVSFTSPADVSRYRRVVFTMKSADPQAQMRVSLRDAAKNDNAVMVGAGKYTGSELGQEVSIPLSDFQEIVGSMVKDIVFSVDGTMKQGNNSVVIENIRFIR